MTFNPDDWATCPQRTHNPPRRTSGANIPGFAQGAIFPGDEACHTCRPTGDLCEERPDADECPLLAKE